MPRPRKRPATQPWNPDENPFRKDMLKVRDKRKGWRTRWVSERNFERFLDQGYQFASIENYGGVATKIAGDATPVDTKIRRRELTLMEIPDEIALQREKFYATLNNRAEQSITRRYKKDAKEVGAESYNPHAPGDED